MAIKDTLVEHIVEEITARKHIFVRAKQQNSRLLDDLKARNEHLTNKLLSYLSGEQQENFKKKAILISQDTTENCSPEVLGKYFLLGNEQQYFDCLEKEQIRFLRLVELIFPKSMKLNLIQDSTTCTGDVYQEEQLGDQPNALFIGQ